MGVSITGIKSNLSSGAVHIFGPMASGAMRFQGAENLTLSGSSDWALGAGDFTIEWFQFQKVDETSFPRIFTVGFYPSASVAVSIEGGTFYFWINGSYYFAYSLADVLNQWVHFAITRESGTLRLFQNGVLLAQETDVTSEILDDSSNLVIGSEQDSNTFFLGDITNFRWVKGAAVYTGNFSVPMAPLSTTAETKLLLLTASAATLLIDSSSSAHAVTNNGVTYSATGPF